MAGLFGGTFLVRSECDVPKSKHVYTGVVNHRAKRSIKPPEPISASKALSNSRWNASIPVAASKDRWIASVSVDVLKMRSARSIFNWSSKRFLGRIRGFLAFPDRKSTRLNSSHLGI